jgi:uncharacterized lipoprotein YddW (UPF0748 family)
MNPPPPRVESAAPPEMRGVWVATVGNLDWPSRPGLAAAAQQGEALALLDRFAAIGLNLVVLQLRPAADALYESALEPWSAALTGVQGRAPGYDPLAFWLAAAHERGLALHAWINPFRARTAGETGPADPGHVSDARPDLVRAHGRQLWLDPGLTEARERTFVVAADLLGRYAVDGLHIDDYFYPYPEPGAAFDDEDSWRAHASGAARDDWRRANVDAAVRGLHETVRRVRPAAAFGVSPFGIWRPGHPPGVEGFDAFAGLFADARRWLREGWADYFVPQLYWRLDSARQPFGRLLDWWLGENAQGRRVVAGHYTGLVGDPKHDWPAGEIVAQVERARAAGAAGSIHFSARALAENRGGVAEALRRGPYARPAGRPTP